jgi:hypothetical protein
MRTDLRTYVCASGPCPINPNVRGDSRWLNLVAVDSPLIPFGSARRSSGSTICRRGCQCYRRSPPSDELV